jgi:hypothetical protein
MGIAGGEEGSKRQKAQEINVRPQSQSECHRHTNRESSQDVIAQCAPIPLLEQFYYLKNKGEEEFVNNPVGHAKRGRGRKEARAN